MKYLWKIYNQLRLRVAPLIQVTESRDHHKVLMKYYGNLRLRSSQQLFSSPRFLFIDFCVKYLSALTSLNPYLLLVFYPIFVLFSTAINDECFFVS